MNAEIIYRLDASFEMNPEDEFSSERVAELNDIASKVDRIAEVFQTSSLSDDQIKEFYASDTPETALKLAGAFASQLMAMRAAKAFKSKQDLAEFIADMMDDYGIPIDEYDILTRRKISGNLSVSEEKTAKIVTTVIERLVNQGVITGTGFLPTSEIKAETKSEAIGLGAPRDPDAAAQPGLGPQPSSAAKGKRWIAVSPPKADDDQD